MRGGTNDTQYSISGSITNNEAIVVNTGFNAIKWEIETGSTDKRKNQSGSQY